MGHPTTSNPVAAPPIKVDRAWIGAPARTITNPTVWLAAATVTLFAIGTTAYLRGLWSAPSVIAVHALATYLGFTVLHEAMHGIAHPSRRVNAALGRFGALPLLISFPLFRGVHYEHHSHTNDVARDPDLIVARAPRWLLPVWLLGVTVEYRVKYFGHRLWRTRAELAETLAMEGFVLGAVVLATLTGHLATLCVLWIAPALIAFVWLAFAFDFLPHYPYDSGTRYYDTRAYPGRVLNVALLGQNYHLIHHLWTTVPWYRYQGVFRAIRPQLEARHARIGFGAAPLPVGVSRLEMASGLVAD